VGAIMLPGKKRVRRNDWQIQPRQRKTGIGAGSGKMQAKGALKRRENAKQTCLNLSSLEELGGADGVTRPQIRNWGPDKQQSRHESAQ